MEISSLNETPGKERKFTVEDPRYSAPYTGESLWPRSDQRLYEYACHEGNYAMGATLRGARMLEPSLAATR